MSTTKTKGTALITGASTGIGAIYADRLAKRGYDLILVARNKQKLSELASRLNQETGRSVRVVRADLSDGSDLTRVEAILRSDPDLTLLVNNAGVASIAPLVDADVAKMDEIVALKVRAVTRLALAAAPAFVARGVGTIINIASIVAISPETLNGVYGASKAYVLALSQSLQHELAGKGVRVQAVLPGATATDLWENAGRHWNQLPAEIVMGTEPMVDASLAGLDAGEVVTIPSLQDGDEWTRYEAARRALSKRFGNAVPAPRYRSTAARVQSLEPVSGRDTGQR